MLTTEEKIYLDAYIKLNQAPVSLEAMNRVLRNFKLSACDWTQLSDAGLSPEQTLAWGEYRQALRDMDLSTTNWPAKP